MPRVLLIGATGYIGSRLGEYLVRTGQHRVYGIARDQNKAKALQRREVTPVVCADPVNDPAPYLEAIESLRIDVVVDVSGAKNGATKILNDVKAAGERRLNRAAGSPKLGFIYCSGMWVHGSSSAPVTDLDIVGTGAPTPPAELVAWRVGVEQAVLASADVLDVAVVRPALIYGGECTIWTSFFQPLLQGRNDSKRDASGKVEVNLDARARPGLIHVDDVVTGFAGAIDKLPLLAGTSVHPVFDLATSQESMDEIFHALAAELGLGKGSVVLVGAGDNLFAAAMSTTLRGSSARAKQLLDWRPTRLNGFVADMDVYAASFSSQL